MKLPERLPARLPGLLFALLAIATVGAFYLTQHLKTKNPLINGSPRADPAVINPRYAGVCVDAAGKTVSFRGTKIAFYLQAKSDNVSVYVVNSDDAEVAEMAGSGAKLIAQTHGVAKYTYFSWNGRMNIAPYHDQYAPAGTYTFHVVLQHEDRDLPITSGTASVAVQVSSRRPTPRVTAVTVQQTNSLVTATTATTTATTAETATSAASSAATAASTSTTASSSTTPAFTPNLQSITIGVKAPQKTLGEDVLVYRSEPNRTLKLVKEYGINPHKPVSWDGLIGGHPAPAGSYLIGLSVKDDSCTTGQFPATLHPAAHSTAGAGVTVSYLSAEPPMTPVAAGQLAAIGVHSGGASYQWALRLAGQSRVIFHGTNPGASTLHVRVPGVGLYELSIVSGGHRTTVPVVASGVGARAAAKVLVVLPALSWQGANATDDDSDGLIDTLTTGGDRIDIDRPLVAGLPAGVADEASLLSYLNSEGLSYDLTTDVALAEGVGPTLTGRSGVILDGSFSWLPAQLVSVLRGFVRAGGGVFADGVDSLQHKALISHTSGGEVAGPAQTLGTDPFGVIHGAISSADGELITSLTDDLSLFSTDWALELPRYQLLEPPDVGTVSAAGIAQSAPTVIGFRLDKGTVVEAGLPNFGITLASDVNAQELFTRVWQVALH